ncbi:hypothetical protein WMY93_023591 [Mugilogobius chulae]|uniref:Transporter n=1 Tax=Mugilogobius chulae TaxID=88201 RepID=A0AAW0N4P3_9GOBI
MKTTTDRDAAGDSDPLRGHANGQSRTLDVLPSPEQKMDERGHWGNKLEFVLSVAGEIIGLGNVWRFPYLCYKNGGGAFFIPYLIFLFACGIPVFLLETALGQFTSEGGITCWRKICPLFEGVGYATQVIAGLLNVYYIIVLAWALFYLSHSFTWDLPWASCNNTWNTDSCVEFQRGNRSAGYHDNATSPVIEFWERRVLRLSSGLDHIGSLNWDLVLCLLLAWIICYFCIWKGVKSTGKVVYFTATFPYLMLVVLLIRGATLPGVWMDAGTQIFFSYAICLGCLTALGSPGLAFIAYPRAVSMMPFSPLWACCFFVMIVFLGLDSQAKNRRELFILAISIVSFLLGLVMLTQGGLYVFQLFDYYAASGMCLLFVSIFETVCIAWIYGADRFYDNIEDMIGYRPGPIIKYCWLFFTPATCLATFAFSLIKYTPLKYNGVYVYPWWGYAIGWVLALSSMLCIPLCVIFKVSTTPGTMKQRFIRLITPSKDLPKTRQEQERLLAAEAEENRVRQRTSLTKNDHAAVKESNC